MIWHMLLTSASDCSHAGSGVVGNSRYNKPVDPRVVEKEPWFLFRNWRRWPDTWDEILARAGCRLGRRTIPPLVCGQLGILGND